MNINKVILVGRLGVDPELKTVSSGTDICNLSVATSEVWTGKDGQKQEKTEWHQVVSFGSTATNAAKYLSKGSLVYVEGRKETRQWEDKNGQKQFTTEIVAQIIRWSIPKKEQAPSATLPNLGPEPMFDNNEEIPF